jgi:IS30 family transposase
VEEQRMKGETLRQRTGKRNVTRKSHNSQQRRNGEPERPTFVRLKRRYWHWKLGLMNFRGKNISCSFN